MEEFKKRNTEVIGVSVDSKFTHHAWANTPREDGGIKGVNYPLVSDLNKQIARDYGVLMEGPGIALRGLFIINKDGMLKHSTINHLDLGRSIDEVLRLLDAVDYTEATRRSLPGKLEEGRKGDEADRSGLEGIRREK